MLKKTILAVVFMLVAAFELQAKAAGVSDDLNCMPLSETISFSGTGNQVDAADVYAGEVPNFAGENHSGTYGQIRLGEGAPGKWMGIPKADGLISMNITNGSWGVPLSQSDSSYSIPLGQATVSGVIHLSAATLNEIQNQFGGPSRSACVSGLALDMGLGMNVPAYPANYVFGNVYLYLNSGMDGYRLYL